MMPTGALTSYFDVAQVTLYLFWVFFAALVVYLLREGKREGYPLESDRSDRAPRVRVIGWPGIPKPKTFLLRDGTRRTAPDAGPAGKAAPIAAAPLGPWPGAPLVPTGNPMTDGVGPGAWAPRRDIVDTTVDGDPRIVPMRVAGDYAIAGRDPDPRGLPVVGADNRIGGTVVDLWVDRAEMLFRYLEVEVAGAQNKRRVLLPINFTRIDSRRVRVNSILSDQFAAVPGTRNPVQVTLLEEEKIMAYYGGGVLYAVPSRQEPLL